MDAAVPCQRCLGTEGWQVLGSGQLTCGHRVLLVQALKAAGGPGWALPGPQQLEAGTRAGRLPWTSVLRLVLSVSC